MRNAPVVQTRRRSIWWFLGTIAAILVLVSAVAIAMPLLLSLGADF